VIEAPLRKKGVRTLTRQEEIAVLQAGLRLDHEDGMGQQVVNVAIEDAWNSCY
jgi:hypothetical protein